MLMQELVFLSGKHMLLVKRIHVLLIWVLELNFNLKGEYYGKYKEMSDYWLLLLEEPASSRGLARSVAFCGQGSCLGC
jgi:hypothetical protein